MMNKIEGFDSVLNSQIGELSSKMSESKIQMEQLIVIDDLSPFDESSDAEEAKNDKKSDSEVEIDP